MYLIDYSSKNLILLKHITHKSLLFFSLIKINYLKIKDFLWNISQEKTFKKWKNFILKQIIYILRLRVRHKL
jgi:hypothetical protein